jgi:hypothetical protein
MTEKYEVVQDNSPAGFAMTLMDKGMDIEKMERLLDMQIKWEANEARKAFHAAMAAFKAEAPVIGKDKGVKFTTQKGTTEYRHATLSNVLDVITPILSKNGLSVTWVPSQVDGGVKVKCVVSHVLGHTQEVEMVGPLDNTGNKNSIQAIGSTSSYLARYTIMLALGLASRDMDDDGVAAGNGNKATITDEQADELQKEINELYGDKSKTFMDWLGVEFIIHLPAKDYGKAKGALAKARERKAA